MPSRIHTGQDIAGIFDTSLQYGCSCWDKSAHNEIRDFYAHMALTHERHFARCFCRYSENIASDISMHNKKSIPLSLMECGTDFFICYALPYLLFNQ